jgi:hypothetical protein
MEVTRCTSTDLRTTARSAFTLLEVIIACAIFFIFAFAVLELVTRGLNAARSIQHHEPDAALILAPFSTNRMLEIGTESGDFEDLYPGIYPGYTWTRDVAVALPFDETNRLYLVTVVVEGTTGKRRTTRSIMSTLMFAPDSKVSGVGGAPMFATPR